MQFSQSERRNARTTEDHASANASVKHPLRQDRYDAWFDLDMNNAATSALLATLGAQTPPI